MRPAAGRGATALSLTRKTSEQRVQNLILLSLDPSEYNAIRPHLEFCTLDLHSALHEPSEPIEFGYFPNAGVISLVVAVSEGKSVEVGIVGREGFIGIPLAGDLKKSPHRSLVQMPGDAYRIKASVLARLFSSAPKLRTSLTRYALVQGMQLAQTAACNRLHNLDQRLARWLLMSQDRAGSHTLAMTHERLASLLGTDRPSVSDAALSLQGRGIIAYTRGLVKIESRRKLREVTCECYEVVQTYYAELGLK